MTAPERTAAVNPAITVRGLTVVRGGRTVLDGLDLDLKAGVITGLLGPSGCGKTTLMRSIVGVQRVAGGEVTVLGRPAGSPELRHTVGYLTQAPSVYQDLTVAQNLRYFAAILGAVGADIDAVIDRVELGAKTGAAVGALSGGERSRVSLAVALLADPRVLILDEPTVGLDPVLRRDLWRTFATLAAAGITLLISSHVMDEAARCNELILMREGQILVNDSLRNVLSITAAADVETAFLALVEDDRDGAGS